jgi:hypothetical protein
MTNIYIYMALFSQNSRSVRSALRCWPTAEMVSSRTILLGSVVISSAIIVSVHYMQVYEKEVMHKGVLRDIERQQAKKLASQSTTKNSE